MSKRTVTTVMRSHMDRSWSSFNTFRLSSQQGIPRNLTQYQKLFLASQICSKYGAQPTTLNTSANFSVPKSSKEKHAGRDVPFAYLQPLAQERRIDNVLQNAFMLDSVHQARSLILRGVVRLNGVKILSSSRTLSVMDTVSISPSILRRIWCNATSVGSQVKPKWQLVTHCHLPSYLEVDLTTGCAIYLRHPTVGYNFAEAVTPYDEPTHDLATLWQRKQN